MYVPVALLTNLQRVARAISVDRCAYRNIQPLFLILYSFTR